MNSPASVDLSADPDPSVLRSIVSRRRWFGYAGVAATALLAGCSSDDSSDDSDPAVASGNASAQGPTSPGVAPAEPGAALNADQAWQELVGGNARFAAGQSAHPHAAADWRASLAQAQHPFATVLGCIDSRVPPEYVFDQGLGDLLIARTAGEVLDDAVIGSVEYGVEHLGVPLVVVLGHANCGAVKAAVDFVQGSGEPTGGVAMIVRSIEAAVLATPPNPDPAAFLAACVAEQVHRTKEALLERSALIAEAVESKGVQVRGATYDLVTGTVQELT